MFKAHRLLALLGGIAAAALVGGVGSALANAEAADSAPLESCDGAVCLVLADPIQGEYGGFRPFLTDWKGDQPYDLVLKDEDGSSALAGNYNINVQDFWSPLISVAQYHYGDFEPNAAAGIDPSGLGWFADMSGASIYQTSLLNGAVEQLIMNNVGPHDVTYLVTKFGDFTNTVVVGDNASADYIQVGDNAPKFLIDSLFHGDLAKAMVPDYLIPPDQWAGLDFDPNDYLAGDLAAI